LVPTVTFDWMYEARGPRGSLRAEIPEAEAKFITKRNSNFGWRTPSRISVSITSLAAISFPFVSLLSTPLSS
jgi:hypothetical protein